MRRRAGVTIVLLLGVLLSGCSNGDGHSSVDRLAAATVPSGTPATGIAAVGGTSTASAAVFVLPPSGQGAKSALDPANSVRIEFRPVLQVGDAAPAIDEMAVDSDGTAVEQDRPAVPSSPSDTAYYITAQVQQQFDALDCTDPADLAGGRVGSADQAFVTCESDSGQPSKYILGPVEIDGSHIAKASAGLETLPNGEKGTRWVVNLEFDATGKSQFAATSERLLGLPGPLNRLGIVVDGLVISAPTVNAVIPDGKVEISGSFTRESAGALAEQLGGDAASSGETPGGQPTADRSAAAPTHTSAAILLAAAGALVLVLVVVLVLVIVLTRKGRGKGAPDQPRRARNAQPYQSTILPSGPPESHPEP